VVLRLRRTQDNVQEEVRQEATASARRDQEYVDTLQRELAAACQAAATAEASLSAERTIAAEARVLATKRIEDLETALASSSAAESSSHRATEDALEALEAAEVSLHTLSRAS
jgi:hypothetical protein